MGSVGRYIFRTTFGAFLTASVSLTALIWLTQALREIDLVTGQGQSVLTFVSITTMIVPLLYMFIAPVALFIAVVHTLNKLSADSEIIVMSAAGMTPWQVFRAYLAVAGVVALMMAVLSTYLSPQGLRNLRDRIVEVRANLVGTIAQPGRFVTVEGGVTFHIRARSQDGQLLGVFMDDRRNPAERVTIVADSGSVLTNDSGTFLVLRTGTVQRYETSGREPSTVVFDRYAIDLSRFSGGPVAVRYSLRERYLWQLLFPDPSDPILLDQPGLFRAEALDRIGERLELVAELGAQGVTGILVPAEHGGLGLGLLVLRNRTPGDAPADPQADLRADGRDTLDRRDGRIPRRVARMARAIPRWRPIRIRRAEHRRRHRTPFRPMASLRYAVGAAHHGLAESRRLQSPAYHHRYSDHAIVRDRRHRAHPVSNPLPIETKSDGIMRTYPALQLTFPAAAPPRALGNRW